MGVLIHPNSYQIDIPEKVVGKIVMGGASTKNSCSTPLRSCSTPQHNIDTTLPRPYNSQRLPSMIEEISGIYKLTLKHEPEQPYILHKSCVMEIFKGDNWLDIY